MTADVPVIIELLPHAEGLPPPVYASALAAGADLHAAVPEEAPIAIPPGGRALVPTGLKMALPAGFEAQVRPRSGLALRHGITILNAPGTIDADYRGEVGVVLLNTSATLFEVRRGERVAQLVIAPVVRAAWREGTVSAMSSERGAGGFGSTGKGALNAGEAPAAKAGGADMSGAVEQEVETR